MNRFWEENRLLLQFLGCGAGLALFVYAVIALFYAVQPFQSPGRP